MRCALVRCAGPDDSFLCLCWSACTGEIRLCKSEERPLSTIESLYDASEETALPAEDLSAQTAQPAQPDELRPQPPTRRRLSPEQEREVARLYAESTTPTSE